MLTENIKKDKILLVLTGGTICSVEDEKGERSSDAEKAKYKIVSIFKNSNSPFNGVDFDCRMPLNILSENMTVKTWNTLLDDFRSIEDFSTYKGIIILHGTDTLAFTSSLLSLMLSHLDIPVILVSAQLPLDKDGTNGNANFRAAAELIMNGIKPNVYAVYRNSDGKMYLHYGSQLKQCSDYSDDFFSSSSVVLENTESFRYVGEEFSCRRNLLEEVESLKAGVLCIVPYVGIDYDFYNLDKLSAVVHNTYHSQTVCVERSKKRGEVSNLSFLTFAEKCKNGGVDLFIAPCNSEAYSYESTSDALDSGAFPVSGMTFETAYVKTLVGASMGLKGEELYKFICE
ncbi:MAG: asparaginase domain-containing protein [Acutalibacteraceae bacterium]|nr:asparaginase domain-containing protein [Acutalibacteraceae bacterium]